MAALTSPAGTRVEIGDNDALGEVLKAQGWSDGVAEDADGAPRGNASRDEWAAYADSLGVEYPEDAKRGDIRAAIVAAEESSDDHGDGDPDA